MIGRTELALRYMPNLTPKSAWRTLNSWISFNRPLRESLLAAGYDGKRRTFTPREVALIYEYLGEP